MSLDARLSVLLPSHPKTKKLIRRLGKAGAWDLVRLFLWVASNRSDGDLSGLSDEDLELSIDFDGDDGAFIAALVEVGFIDGQEGARRVHDWGVDALAWPADPIPTKRRRPLDVTYHEWIALRSAVFARDGYRCIYCEMATDSPECDHIHPVSRGGLTFMENLATACKPCNRSKGAKTLDEWRAQ